MLQIFKPLFLLTIVSILFSQDPESLYNQGLSKLEKAEINKAEEALKESLKIDPSFAPSLQGLSKLYLYKGDLKKANEYAIKAVQADEDFREWSNKISKISEQIQNGNRNVQQGLFEEAIKEYDSILSEHPYYPEAEFYKGLTRFRQKNIDGAA